MLYTDATFISYTTDVTNFPVKYDIRSDKKVIK